MRKRDEQCNGGCFAKALDDEMTFVLLARDKAAPVAIFAWINERIRIGKNQPGDALMTEAAQCARIMEAEQEQSHAKSKLTPTTPGTDAKDEAEKRLSEIEARANAATAGPWKEDMCAEACGCCDKVQSMKYPICRVVVHYGDAPFIAHARDDIPWLLSLARQAAALKAENQNLRKAVDVLRASEQSAWDAVHGMTPKEKR